MEVEVRAVAAIESCFVSLPTVLIQTLESTCSGPGSLPPFLALELRSQNSEHPWYVAWSGSASSSSAIEISQRYAECISLTDRARVQMRAVPNLPKATLVTIEPYTEDDWEVLELNAELAESDILSQVGIAQEDMRFPIWLHGRNVITFTVVSTLPKSSAVQLVPGTELSVAPKRRKRNIGSSKDASMQSLIEEHSMRKALLRVQDPGSRLMHSLEVNGMEMEVELTSAIFIHPETAKKYKFEPPQLVVIEPRLTRKRNINALRSSSKNALVADQHNSEIQTEKQNRTLAVNLFILESVAKGHVMVSKPIRLYLQTSIHSWMYVKGCSINVNKEFPLLSVSPFQFKMSGNSEAFDDNSYEAARNQANLITKDPSLKTKLNADTFDRSVHERVVAALYNNSPSEDGEEIDILSRTKVGLCCLLKTWYFSQLHLIASIARVQLNTLALGNTTLLHFILKGDKLVNNGKVQLLSNSETSKPSIDVMYLLHTCDDELQHENLDAYELNESNWGSNDVTSSDALERKLKLGESFILPTIEEKLLDKNFKFHISSLSWMGTAASDVINRLILLLSSEYQITHNLPLPGHILIYGPPGSGKTLLGTTAAKFVEEHEEILSHIIFVGCSKFSSEKSANIRQTLSGYVSEALNHAPSVIIFDDLDSIVSSSDGLDGSQPSASVVELTQLFLDIMDEYQEKRRNSCGIGPIAFIASAQSLTKIPQSLSSSGRFDFHVQLPPPAATERGALLKLEIQKRSLSCSDDILFDVASKCDGYDAYDLEILVDRAVHVASGRFLSPDVILKDSDNVSLLKDDFMHAMHDFLPVSMRDLNKTAPEGSRSGWLDVGGLTDIKNSIKEMIELPSKYPNVFAKSPLRLRSNVLLYGPPGCGKTHIVGAAAAACSLRFISIKGPELLNKYIGASEQAVRDIFAKAAAAAPCLLFFDEFDSIAPKRGHDNTGVTDRVVNQFLTELDGVEVLTGVFVFAATSRPDLLDAALLRPGRLDRLLFCDFPSRQERLDILTVLSQKLPLAIDVDLDYIANVTDGLSGADLQALLSDAQLAAVHDALDKVEIGKPVEKPVISNNLLYSVASKARPSVSDSEKQRLYSIYNQFLDAKRSVSSQARDAKGKRATLA